MKEIIVRRSLTKDGEEIIELDLNRMGTTRPNGYSSYMDEVERLSQKPRKTKKEFITVLG